MKGRMSKEDRRDHLLCILMARFKRAQSQADFTAVSLSSEAGVSTVWFYALVGGPFKRLRSKLPGPVPPGETLVARLRKEISELRAQLKELRGKYEAGIKEKFAVAIRQIELLDEENRMLRQTVAALERRLSEDRLVIPTALQNNSVAPDQDHT